MADLHRTTLGDHENRTAIHLDDDGSLSLTKSAENQKTGIAGFLSQLMEAHRYVQNRRSASNPN